jgi:hypothetical protein
MHVLQGNPPWACLRIRHKLLRLVPPWSLQQLGRPVGNLPYHPDGPPWLAGLGLRRWYTHLVYPQHLGRINDVLIMVNNNLVPVDFLVMDVEFNALCPIILGRPFLRTVGAIIDMREGTIKYQFPLKKGMEHFSRKRKKLLFDSILRANY